MLRQFLSMSDAALDGTEFRLSDDELVASYSYRIQFRLLPRQVYRLSAAATGDRDGALLKNYFTRVEDKAQRRANIEKLELEIGRHLLELNRSLGEKPEDALRSAGVWVDVPKVPTFEDVFVIVGRSRETPGVRIADVFPIGQWTEAYEAHRFYIRIYAFSEHCEIAQKAARAAIETVIGITSNEFFEAAGKDRTTP